MITDSIYEDTPETAYFLSYDPLSEFPKESQDLIPVKRYGKWGYINKLRSVIISYKYEAANHFCEGKASIKLNDKWGYINTEGEVIIPFSFDEAYNFYNSVAQVASENKYGFINDKGNWLVRPTFDYVSVGQFQPDITKIKKLIAHKSDYDGLLAIENGLIKALSEPVYSKLYPYESNEVFYVINEKNSSGEYTGKSRYGYLDENGKDILSWSGEMRYYRILSEGMRAVRNRNVGLINYKGIEVISPLYESEVQMYSLIKTDIDSEGFWFNKNGKWIYMDIDGNQKFKNSFSEVENFRFGYAGAKKNNKWGLIDRNGNKIVDFKFDRIFIISGYDSGKRDVTGTNMVAVQIDGKWGIIAIE